MVSPPGSDSWHEATPQGVATGLREAYNRWWVLMDSWVAIPSTGDRRGRALRLARAHDAVLSGAPPPPELRGVIADSWRRCTAAGFDAQRGLAPIALAGDE